MRLLFDLETNGLLDHEALKVHCIVAQDVDTGEMFECGPSRSDQEAFVHFLMRAECLLGHNICRYDIPVLERLFSFFKFFGDLIDTVEWSRLAYFTNQMARSGKFRNSAGRDENKREMKFPKRLFMQPHSLEAWGYRLRFWKGDFLKAQGGAAKEWSQELQDYCKRDVQLNTEVFYYLCKNGAERKNSKRGTPAWPICSQHSIHAESAYSRLLAEQEAGGVGFDVVAAGKLYAVLATKRDQLKVELREFFPDWIAPDGPGKVHTPKRTVTYTKDREYPEKRFVGAAFSKIKVVQFNPASTQHRAMQLQKVYGWQPLAEDYTDSGIPKTSEAVLSALDYPCIPMLTEYVMVSKKIGMLAEGKQAWLKHVNEHGVIYGRIKTTGTRTSRCSHSKPNLGQVPKVGKPYGADCRALFGPTQRGWVQVGADASGLELRMLASRLYRYDGGAFWRMLEEQGDPHNEWMVSTGIFIRDNQKTFTYALLYGAGDEKLGLNVLKDWRMAFDQGLTQERPPARKYAMELGKRARGKLLRGMPALDKLLRNCKNSYKRGFIVALDGRVLACPSEHGALNDVLQSDGAIVMKHAKIEFDRRAREDLPVKGEDWRWMLDVHDEWQLQARTTSHAEVLGELMCGAIKTAGEQLGIRVPLDGEYKIGANWAETH